MRRVRTTPSIALETKLAHLLRPSFYPDAPTAIELVETHFAWVFLSRNLVYKMKKPIRFRAFDFTTLAARRADCELEVALNRRLADVYLGVVPLCASAGVLGLETDGEPIEWLVKMRRLPRERFLDVLLAAGDVDDAALAPAVDKLCAFYANSTRATWDGAAYRRALERRIREYAAELAAPDLLLDRGELRSLERSLTRFCTEHATWLAERAAAGRVVDAHGDLRPEHVALTTPPEIIDCLEFSAELRLLDAAEEIAFLTLECERLGAPEVGRRILARYRQSARDAAPDALLEFYRALRALARALLAALRLRDDQSAAAAERWRERTRWYLAAAGQAAARALCVPPGAEP
jgi:aminoglycoside phosphotransferase family enzyme